MNDVRDLDYKELHGVELQNQIEMLNSDQRRIFNTVNNHLLHQKQHEKGECTCKDMKPLHMFISGVGGTGKSFLIDTIRSQTAEIWKDDVVCNTTCAVCAPIGLASYNVNGITVYRLFQLPIEHGGKTAGYWSLSKVAQKFMHTNLHSLKVVIIDDVSMLSNLNLAYIHLRLDETIGCSGSQWFGSTNILFVGDLLQLPPVNGQPVFSRLCNKTVVNRLGCMTTVNIWKETVVCDELTINEHQKKDPGFSEILNEVRCGTPSQKTLESLSERVITKSVIDKSKELSTTGTYPVCLFPTCAACNKYNEDMLSSLGNKIHKIVCIDEIDETKGKYKWTKRVSDALKKLNQDCNMTGGLEAEVSIAIGVRVMLRRNIDTKKGLVNGAIGSVTHITLQRLIVKFDQLKEPYPIERIKGNRKQFPLILAFAITIHKCQDLSLNRAIIKLSDKVFRPGMAYVALSRVYLTEFDPSSITVSNACLEEINRLQHTLIEKTCSCTLCLQVGTLIRNKRLQLHLMMTIVLQSKNPVQANLLREVVRGKQNQLKI